MPELPEVETIRRQLSLFLPGQRVERVLRRGPFLRLRETGMRLEQLEGWRFSRLDRWGKELFLRLEAPEGSRPPGGACLRVHLGMTGRLYYLPSEALTQADSSSPASSLPRPAGNPARESRPAGGELDRHLHLVLGLERGELRFRDPRRFGRLVLERGELVGAGREEVWGPDLWERPPDPEEFRKRLGRARIKAALLDQRRFSGLGNIYADESLFRAGIHPLRPASALSPDETARLLRAIREVLAEAIEAGGTTFSDYRNGRGEPGGFRPRLRVYGREGEPCLNCGSPIGRMKLGGRSSYFCPRCQGAGSD